MVRPSPVKISGDFFLEPEEAYFDLAPALVGASVNADNATLRGRLDEALAGYGSELAMHGFSTADIATVVRRALGSAANFTDFDWQVIRGEVLPTQLNVALDQVLLEEVAAGRRQPTLRFWEWEDTATVIGPSSPTSTSGPKVWKYDVQVVRRISGGGAMFMEGGNCITLRCSSRLPSSPVSTMRSRMCSSTSGFSRLSRPSVWRRSTSRSMTSPRPEARSAVPHRSAIATAHCSTTRR